MQRCANCSLSLVHPIRRYQIEAATDVMQTILQSWICPATLSADTILCQECYMLLQAASVTGSSLRAYGHKEVCFVCGISILRAKTHKVPPSSPEANIIMSSIPIQQAQRLEKVCLRCWTNAYRSVRRQESHEQNRHEILHEETSSVPTPPSLPPMPEVQHNQPVIVHPKIISQVYKRAAASSKQCMFNECQHTERLLVPSVIKELLLLEYKLYIPANARICSYHLNNGNWSKLVCQLNDFTGRQMDDMMFILDRASRKQLDFADISKMNPHICQYWLGMTPEQFTELLINIPALAQEVPCPSVALSIILAKLRTGDSNERLSKLFQIPRSTLERYMHKAGNCLYQAFPDIFVPRRS